MDGDGANAKIELIDPALEEEEHILQLPNQTVRKNVYNVPANRRVQPVFWSNNHYLQISQIGIPIGYGGVI